MENTIYRCFNSDTSEVTYFPENPITKAELYYATHPFPNKYRYLKSYSYNWRVRLRLQAEKIPGCFVTLTYNDEHYLDNEGVVRTREDFKRDFQLFMKRLRRTLDYHHESPTELSYFATSEYGDLFNRFHYHICLFGLVYCPSTLKLLEKCWQNGFVKIGTLNSKSINYVTKYLFKRVFDKRVFSLKSKGLGSHYFTDAQKNYFTSTLTTSFRLSDGVEYFMGRYLREKIFTKIQRDQMNEIRGKRESDLIHEFNYGKKEIETTIFTDYFDNVDLDLPDGILYVLRSVSLSPYQHRKVLDFRADMTKFREERDQFFDKYNRLHK